MDFAFTDEQQMLRDAAQGFFDRHAPPAAARTLLGSAEGFDRTVWQGIVEMGWPGIGVPETAGGFGLGPVELAIIYEQAGSHLCPSPLQPGGLAADLLVALGEVALVPGIVAGEAIVTVAYAGRSGQMLALDARIANGVLEGEAGFVPFGHVADLILVVAREGDALRLAFVEANTQGLDVVRPTQMDLLRPEAQMRFEGVRPSRIVELPEAVLRAAMRRATIRLAAEQVGGAQRCLDLSVDYARQRIAFGRPIGSFQAIKHRLADMAMRVETARSAAYYAACLAQDGDDAALAYASAMAKSYCSEAFSACAGDAIQIHGGIGFTWEHEAHLLFKQAASAAAQFAPPAAARRRIAELLELT